MRRLGERRRLPQIWKFKQILRSTLVCWSQDSLNALLLHLCWVTQSIGVRPRCHRMSSVS